MNLLLALLLAGAEGEPPKAEPFWPAPAQASPPAPASPPAAPSTPAPAPATDAPATGIWPAPPPVAQPPAPGPPVTLLGGLVLGATDQVQPNVNGLIAGELGLLAGTGAVRVGGMTSLGMRRDAGAWSFGVLIGYGSRRTGRAPVDLLGELGVQGFWLVASDSLLTTRTISGGSATLPYLGARLLIGAGTEPSSAAIGLFLQQTLRSTTSRYRVTDCFFTCQTVDAVARYGGFAAGLTIDLAVVVRSQGSTTPAPAATSAPVGSW